MARTVLIVDDSAVNREILNNTLRNDYEVLEAENGKEAFELLLQHHDTVAAVVMDIDMPIMDGYEALRRIRENAFTAHIPVIMNTGSEDEASRTKALTYGASDFLVKPYSPEIILHCLKNNIAIREVSELVNIVQRDRLTGLYNRDTFFEKAAELIDTKEPGFFVLSHLNIDHFKVVND